jgi:hypothetical protein
MADAPEFTPQEQDQQIDPEILKAVRNYLKRQAYNKAWRERTGYNRRRWQQEKALLQRARELGLL